MMDQAGAMCFWFLFSGVNSCSVRATVTVIAKDSMCLFDRGPTRAWNR